MNPSAIVLLVFSLTILWGGLAASIVALARRPERTDWPAGWSHEEDET